MTEQQWLTSTNPVEMYAFVRDRMTERQRDFSAWSMIRDPKKISDGSWIIRDIVGNPFRPYILDGGSIFRLQCKEPFSDCREPFLVIGREMFTWNNGTIPKLVSEILRDQCAKIPGCQCYICNGSFPPKWSLMPVLADALEEAGCRETAILNHLRGWETCPWCEGSGFNPDWTRIGTSRKLCYEKLCNECNGTGKRPITHVRGCWVLELLRGK